MHRRPTYILLAAATLLTAIGCGKSSFSAVHGRVTLDGEPIENGGISFLPPSGAGSKAAAAIEQGVYSIPAKNKLLPGAYRVEINWRKPTGRKVSSADPGIIIDETREVVPPKYNTNSTLTTEIAGGNEEKNFELTAK